MNNFIDSPRKIFPEIDLGNVLLREQQEYDVADFFNYYTDPEVNKYILCELPRDLESARHELHYWRNVFHRNDGIYFAIADKQTNRMIGSIGLSGYNSYHSRIELSYDLSQHFWRRGIMTRAIAEVVKYGFEIMKINRIEAFVSTLNKPSEGLLLKCGFTLEGTLRQHRYHRGEYVDAHSFSLLRQDYLSNKNY